MTDPTSDIEGISKILVVTAHPDDVDFGSGGTIARWTKAGVDVQYCIATDGDAGGFDEAVPRNEIGPIRRREQTAAAKTVGVTQIHWLGYPDGRVTASLDLRRDISRVIRQVKPDRVLAQSPERNWERIYASHPDHLAVGEATACAVYPDARNPFAFPELLQQEGLKEHTVPELWLMAFSDADEASDITDTFDTKVAALRCHESQVAHRDDLEQMLRGWSGAIASKMGLPEGRLAEAFRRVNTA